MKSLYFFFFIIFCFNIYEIQASASWDYVTAAIDADTKVTQCIFLAGNNASAPAYSHVKGTELTTLSQRISVASASKIVASSIILRLVESGVLAHGDLVSKYLTYWTKSSGDPRSKVTLQQLLAFTGGFKADDVCCGDSGYTMQSCAQQIYNNATGSNFNAAGSTFYYGCNNLQVAGAMAEVASGKSWATLFTQYWKEPLGITDSLNVWTPLPNPNVAGGLFCSTQQYLSFLLALFGRTFFAQQSTYDLLYTDNTPSDSVAIGYSPLAVIKPTQVWHYCQGNWLECESKQFTASCTSAQAHSSPGKFGFYPRIDLVNNYWSIVARMQSYPLSYTDSVQMFQKIESNVTALLAQTATTSSTTGAASTTTTTTTIKGDTTTTGGSGGSTHGNSATTTVTGTLSSTTTRVQTSTHSTTRSTTSSASLSLSFSFIVLFISSSFFVIFFI